MTEAWHFAALAASASVGKLPSLNALLMPEEMRSDLHSAQLLSGLFKLKAKGVPMTIERLH